MNIIVWIVASGFFSAAVGVVFGLPSLRIKGFYLAVATLAAQFFLSWCFIRMPWLYNYNTSGAIEVPTRTLFGIPVTGATASRVTRYFVVLGIVIVMTWLASNLVHGRIGRMWMAVRDMDHRRRAHRHPAAAAPSCSPSRSRRSTAASPARCWCSCGTAAPSRRCSTST